MDTTLKKAVRIPVYEFERGWGNKLDDWMVCVTEKDALDFQKSFNAKNDKSVVPDWYMVCMGDVESIELSETQYDYLLEAENKRTWLSSINHI
jgi:hypothetical protein